MQCNEFLWPYSLPIKSRKRRFSFALSKKNQWSINTKINDFISATTEAFGPPKSQFDCIVRYIGPVPELHPVGYFFGLELLHLENGHSLQKNDVLFAGKNLRGDPSLSIFVTVDCILPISLDTKRKFSALNLIGDTLDKVCCAITNNLSINTSGTEKRSAQNTSQFYVTKTTLSENSSNNNMSETEASSEKVDTSKSDFILKNDDNKKGDNYGINVKMSDRSKGISGTSKQQQKVKSAGISSLEGRDIIIIDNADIQESTKNESDVIVVEKSIENEVDLADLLGNNWPNVAGHTGIILNKEKEKRLNNGNTFQIPKVTPDKNKSLFQSQDNKAHSNNEKQIANTCTEFSNDSRKKRTKIKSKEIKENNFTVCNDTDEMECGPILKVVNTSLGIGSLVEVCIPNKSETVYGVIRWVGLPPGSTDVMVGIELEDTVENNFFITTNGCFNGYQLFKCQENRAIFVLPEHCAIDKRFIESSSGSMSKDVEEKPKELETFGTIECPSVPGSFAPLKIFDFDDLSEICGKFKGIQGHHNSCYLDATLFAMFTFTSVFDSLLHRQPNSNDVANYLEVQTVLREEIVNPLRKNMFVRADRVMKLRKLLDKLSSISGLTCEEKDPEEFLNCLLSQIMRVEPFLKLNSGQDSYFYQLFVEKDEQLTFPTVQQLFEQSFHSSNIKLKEVPSCMIIQMPRFGKTFKMYQRILPSQVLDVTDILENSPRQCTVCGKLAEFECPDCFGSLHGGMGLEGTSFCHNCLETVHMHSKRSHHKPSSLSVPQDFRIMSEHISVPRLYMELFAVVCIETSHYVSFVKAGSGPDAPWCFFDSMADRKGEQNGYNIPEMVTIPELPKWLSDDGAKAVNETSINDKLLPEHAKRLFCDAYMCMYQSTDIMMYR